MNTGSRLLFTALVGVFYLVGVNFLTADAIAHQFPTYASYGWKLEIVGAALLGVVALTALIALWADWLTLSTPRRRNDIVAQRARQAAQNAAQQAVQQVSQNMLTAVDGVDIAAIAAAAADNNAAAATTRAQLRAAAQNIATMFNPAAAQVTAQNAVNALPPQPPASPALRVVLCIGTALLSLAAFHLLFIKYGDVLPTPTTPSAAPVSTGSISSSDPIFGARVRFLGDGGDLVEDKFVTLQRGAYYPTRKRLYFWLGADDSSSTLEGVTIRTGRADRVLAAHVKSVLKPFAGEKRTGALVEQINADGSTSTSVTVMGGTFHKRSGAIWLLLKEGDNLLGLDKTVFVEFLDRGSSIPTD